MEDRSRDGRIRPAGKTRPLQPGHPTLVVTGETGDGLEVRHGHPPILDDDSLAPPHTVDEGAELILGLGYTGSFHKAIIALTLELLKPLRPA